MKYKGNEKPSEELLESLKEVEDYKNGDIELDTYEDVKEMNKQKYNNLMEKQR